MTRIKLFCGSNPETLEADVNRFIANVTVITIQLSSTSDSFDILVTYKEAAQ